MSRAIVCPSNTFAIAVAELVLHRLLSEPRDITKLGTAVVLDIDGTAIYNTDETIPSRPNDALQALYQRLLQRGVHIFFLTARQESRVNREYTVRELRANGYPTFTQLYMRPSLDSAQHSLTNYSFYKASMRRFIGQSYELLLSVGDTRLDMAEWTSEGTLVQPQHAILEETNSDNAYLIFMVSSTPLFNVKLKG